MITAAELKTYLETLRDAGITGKVKVGEFEFAIPPPVPEKMDPAAVTRSLKKEYDTMLFAATEGIPDEGES